MANNLALSNEDDWVVESTPLNNFEKNNTNELPDGFEVERISGEISKAPSPIENVINTLKWVNNTRKSAYQEGKDMVRTADLETKDATVGLNYVEQAELDNLTNSGKTYEDYGVRAKENYKNEKWTLKGLAERAPHFAKTSYIETLKMLPIIVETTKSAVATGTIGAGGGAVAGLAGGPFSEVTVPAGAGIGWLWGARIGAATRIAEIEGGLARNELRRVNKEIEMEGGKPLSTLEINALASSVGVANAGLELVGLNAILKTVPAGKLLLEKMGQKSVRELAKDKVLRAKLAEVTKDYALSVATEPTTEMVQEISNIIAEEYARKLGGVENTPMEQNIARVIETGKAAFGATLFLGGFGSVAKVSTIMVQNGMEKAQAEKVAESMTLDERAEFIAENADTLISTAPNQAQEIENKISENEKEDIENDFFRKAVNSGVDESQAFALSRMLGTFAQKFAPSAEKIKEWSDKIQVRYNVPSENILYGEISNDIESTENRAVRIAEIEKEIQKIAANEDDIDFKRLDELEEEYNNLKKEESENNETQSYNIDKNLKENFDMSSDKLVDMVKADIDNILQDTDVTPEKFSMEDLRVYGSYAKGKNKATSDLDIIVQYSGNMREDDAFNMFADAGLVITDKNGNEIKVDVNPINIDKSGTIEDNLNYFDSLDTKFQSIETAGASENNIKAAAKEWKEKGTDSKYFKKWFGDSKVVDESGKPLVVYHGTESDEAFSIFETNSPEGTPAIYFSNNKKVANSYSVNLPIFEVYLKMENPLEVDAQGKEYNDFTAEMRSNIDYANRNGYDGVIVKNIRDGWSQNKGGKVATTYVVFNPEQIKSVDNKGTFDRSNPNIYYQSETNNNVVDWTDKFEKVPTFEEIEKHIKDIIASGEVFDTLSPEWKIDIKGGNRVVDKITNQGNFQKLQNSAKKRHNKYVAGIKELINNSTYSHTGKNDKPKEKPNILNYHYFDVNIRIGGKTYLVRLECEENKKVPQGRYAKRSKQSHQNISNLTQKNNNVKIVHLYNIKEIKSPKIYFQSAYHGSPHKFDEFSLDAIGTGEGAQAHGWGLYFAGNKDVSEGYRQKLLLNGSFGTKYDIKINGKPADTKIRNYILNNFSTRAINNIIENPSSFKEEVKDYVDILELDIERNDKWLQTWRDAIDLIDKNPKMSITEFSNSIDKNDKYRFKYIIQDAKNKAKNENRRATIKDVENSTKNFLQPHQERIDNEREQLKKLSEIDNIEIKKSEGQLYKVDIPDIDEMLDEDKDLIHQSNKVQRAIEKIYSDAMASNNVKLTNAIGITGKETYRGFLEYFGSDKKASEFLNSYGIKGITYDGRQDGRCYVIFDDKAVNILKTYYQNLGDNSNSDIKNARGFTYRRYNFDGTVKDNLIVLLKNKSDKSTLLHEFAHVYLTTLNDLARDNAKAKADLLVVNKWLGFNGIEYTTSQHEKFANGFVAYVRTGKAPTYGLKKAFEQFKRWLNELYNDLVYSENIELDDGAKAVFDEILGGKSQEAVAEQIEDFVKKAENNALLRLRAEHSEKQKLPPNVLSEYQRKYRDTAYNIVWYALSHIKKKEGGFEEPLVKDKRQLYMLLGNDSKINRKNKGVMKQAEKLEHILSECDDVFSGNDGFLSEWGEFFNDPGIGQDEGADTTLALTALDVIKQRKYLYETEKAIEGITDEDIKRAQYELDYILDEFKNNSDRDLVVAGFFDWVDKQPDFLQEDFITKWENTTNEIERYESLSKFEQAKEDLKLYAATLKGFGDYSWQFAEYARKVLKRLDFMTEHDKAKMFDKLKDFNSFREIERNLDDIMDYAETLNDVSLRRNLADTIVSEVKHTTPEIKNGTKKTRYDYRTNKLFERLRYLNKLTQEQVQDLYDAYVNGELERRSSQFEENGTIVGKTEDYFQDIENSFLQFKANGMYYNSTELLQTLLAKIQNAKFTGKVARDEMDFETRMNQQNWINSCAKSLETHRGKNGKLEELYSMEANLDSMLSMLFDDNIKKQFSLDDLFAQVDGRVGKDREEILNKISKIFGFEGPFKDAMLNNKFIEMANEKYTIKQRYADKGNKDTTGVWSWEPIELSKMEILYYYIQAKKPVSYSMLTDMGDETHAPKGQFDKFEFDELLKNLSDQEKLMGDALQIAAEKYYNDLNKYHIKKHHIDLGKAMCYFPRKSELKEINELDLFNQYTEKSTNPKFVKMRSAGPSIRIAPANPINVLFNHIQKANTIIIMGDKLDLMNKVFRDNDLGQKIKSVFGENVYKEFMQHITENLYNGQAKTLSNAEGIISKLMSNIIGVPMFIKPQVGLKQIMGLINYGVGDEHVGTIEWMKAFTKVIKNPKSAIDFMMQDEYLKDRLTRGNMNEAMKNQIDNKLTSKLSLLTDYFSLNMRYGDLFNLTLGGKAYIDVLMNKGYTKTQAFELFRKKTISDQQSSISSTLSNLQRNSKNNPFARLLFAYQNTPHQYFRICADAIIKAKQGKISKTQAIKTTFIYWWFLPFIFNMAGSLSPLTLLATGNPDELINDALIACLGSISCIPFFGEMGRALFAGVTGSEYFGNKDWFTRANEAIVKPMNKYRKGNLNFEDILKSLEIFAQGFGIPLEEIDTQLEAIGDYAQGDLAKGFIKTLGYSRYRADAVTGEK